MNLLYLTLCSLIIMIARIIITKIRENEKRARIKAFEKMDNSKIEAIGNYEKKSRNKYSKSTDSEK